VCPQGSRAAGKRLSARVPAGLSRRKEEPFGACARRALAPQEDNIHATKGGGRSEPTQTRPAAAARRSKGRRSPRAEPEPSEAVAARLGAVKEGEQGHTGGRGLRTARGLATAPHPKPRGKGAPTRGHTKSRRTEN